MFSRILASIALLATLPLAYAEVTQTTANNGQLVMEDIPPIPRSIVRDLNRYQNVRSAGFRAWTLDSSGIYVSTRFGDVDQIHHVGHPGGARTQLTFFSEPTGEVSRQPGNSAMAFTMDAGGSEFAQIFLIDPATGAESRMLSDGESQNGSLVWSRDGRHLAFRSTRRNGSSNDVWLIDVSKPDSARMIMESPDGSYWMPADFSADGGSLLILNYVGNADSRIHLLDIETGQMTLVAGDPSQPSSNFPAGFDASGKGFWYTTDSGGEFQQLAWKSLQGDGEPVLITHRIPWHV